MIRCGNKLRLHQNDIERLYKLTGVRPTNIQTVDKWNRFVEQRLACLDDSTDEGRLIGLLLQDERLIVESGSVFFGKQALDFNLEGDGNFQEYQD